MNTRRIEVSSGEKYGEFTVVREVAPFRKPSGQTQRAFFVTCSCGAEKVVRLASLRSGETVSCGHVQKLRASDCGKAFTTHGESKTNLYSVWSAMKRRCHNQNDKSFPRYGGRGIQVCQEWRDSFAAFKEYMGDRPEGLTIDRINTNGNYEPGNVRWATYKEQARNTRRNHLHTIDGVTKCLAEWCEILNEPWTAVKKRLAAGRDPFIRVRSDRRLYAEQ